MADNAAAISSIVTNVSNNAAGVSSNAVDIAAIVVDVADNKVMMQFLTFLLGCQNTPIIITFE